MPVSPDCIAAVRTASGDTLTDQEATDLIRSMEARRTALEAAGNIDNLEARLRAEAAGDADKARIAAAVARKHAALTAIAFTNAMDHIETVRATGSGITRVKAALAFLEGTTRLADRGRDSIAATAMAYRARFMEAFNLAVVRDPETAALVKSGDRNFSAAVVWEMRELRHGGQPGITGNQLAAKLAGLYGKIAELARTDLNRLGATIGRLEGWSPQAHDAAKVARATFEDWRDWILPRLDTDRTFPNMSEPQRQAMVQGIYREIVTGVAREPSAAELGQRVGPANLANSLGDARTLHFRDAGAWIQYAEKFGNPDIHAAMQSHLIHAARSAAQMEKLGPNPGQTWQRILATMQRQAASDSSLTPPQRAAEARELSPLATNSKVGSAWSEVSGLSASAGNLRMAEIGSGIRAWMSLSKLGGAVVSSVTDLATKSSALIYQGMPIGRAIADNARELLSGRGRGEMREIAAVLDAGIDGIKNHIAGAGLADDLLPGKLHKLTTQFFDLQGMTWWQDANKAGAARMLAHWMGLNSSKSWDELGTRYTNTLRQHGITPERWDVVRSLARQAEDGRHYVTPDLMRDIPLAKLVDMARPQLDAAQTGLADRAAARVRANDQEAGWVQRRTQRLAERVQEGLTALQKRNRQTEAAADRRVQAIQERITDVQVRLSELDEFHQAVKEGRSWAPAAGEIPAAGDRPFTPKTERYLDTGSPETLAARAEGELRERAARLRRSIGAVKRELGQTETDRLRAFLSWWDRREVELTEFANTVERRIDQRKAATAGEEADWNNRASRILTDTRDGLELQLRRFFADEMGFAYLETDAASRRIALQGTQPGTITGEAARILMQFKGYPVAFTQRIGGRAMRGYSAEERLLQTRNLGVLIAGTMGLGILAMTAKDVIRGYGPRDWTKGKTWLAALAQGGGLGIYGDYLFAQSSRFGNSVLESAAGPTAGAAANVIGLFQKARDGEAKAGEALNVILQNTPFLNLWYARPALDLLILNSLRESVAPGFMQRQEKRRFDDFGQRPLRASIDSFM